MEFRRRAWRGSAPSCTWVWCSSNHGQTTKQRTSSADVAAARDRPSRAVVLARPAHGRQPRALARRPGRRAHALPSRAGAGPRDRPIRGPDHRSPLRPSSRHVPRPRTRPAEPRLVHRRRRRRARATRSCCRHAAAWHRHPLPSTVGARREAELYMATARAHHERVRGKTTAGDVRGTRRGVGRIPVPYQVAKARWWQAQAALPTRARRAEARRALLEAWKISGDASRPAAARALRDLAQRGRITLPAEKPSPIPIEPDRELVAEVRPRTAAPRHVAPRASSTASLPATNRPAWRASASARARYGVLLVLAEGRTNSRDRRSPVHQRAHRRSPRPAHPVQARRQRPRRSGGVAIRLGLVPEDRRRHDRAALAASSALRSPIGQNCVHAHPDFRSPGD